MGNWGLNPGQPVQGKHSTCCTMALASIFFSYWAEVIHLPILDRRDISQSTLLRKSSAGPQGTMGKQESISYNLLVVFTRVTVGSLAFSPLQDPHKRTTVGPSGVT